MWSASAMNCARRSMPSAATRNCWSRISSLQPKPRDQVRVVRRSADHLSGLIDGILDISKIEAGRLYLSRDEVRLSDFLDQLVGMFRLQAAAKGIDFVFKRPNVLPVVVYRRRKAAAPDPDQPAVQRHQVHPARQRAVRRALPQPGRRIRGDRYRPRHPGRRPRTHLRAVRARRARRVAAAYRHRTGPDHQPAAGRRDGRRHPGHQHGRHRQHVPRQDAAVGSHQPDADRAGRRADSSAITARARPS